jgi:hypothetical protein
VKVLFFSFLSLPRIETLALYLQFKKTKGRAAAGRPPAVGNPLGFKFKGLIEPLLQNTALSSAVGKENYN